MIGYRCMQAQGDNDFSASYTAKVNGNVVPASAVQMFFKNSTMNHTDADTIEIGNNIINCSYMFGYCENFNSNVIIGRNVECCRGMFENCWSLNSNITLGRNIQNCSGMFVNCAIFNRNIIGSIKASDCSNMFNRCREFNQPLVLENGVVNCYGMLSSCNNYNQDIVIPKTVNNTVQMLMYHNGTGNIYVNGSASVAQMLIFKNKQKRVNVFCNNIDVLSETQYPNTIIRDNIIWQDIENGYYNSTWNIYIYNNYVGT